MKIYCQYCGEYCGDIKGKIRKGTVYVCDTCAVAEAVQDAPDTSSTVENLYDIFNLKYP